MTELPRFRDNDSLDDVVRLAPLEIEHLSAARHVHAASFRLMSGSSASAAECEAYANHLLSIAYTDELMAAVQAGRLIGAWIDRELVGTAGWTSASGLHGSDNRTAAIEWVYVRPMFIDCGVGRRLVSDVELRAARAGNTEAAVRSTVSAVEFFERLGYRPATPSTHRISNELALPVVIMRKSLTHAGLAHLTRH